LRPAYICLHMLKRIPTHIYDPETGYLYTLRTSDWPSPPIAGYYLRSERDHAGHEVCVFSRTPPYALRGTAHCAYPHSPLTHTCRFRFEKGKRIRWMSDNRPERTFFPQRRKEQWRVRILVPEDISKWIYATHGTPRTWILILLRVVGSYAPELERLLRAAPHTYDPRTMYAVAQYAGRYVTSTACVPHRMERTAGARNSFFRDTLLHLSTLEGLQFVRAHKHKFPGRPIPLTAATPDAILTLPRPHRALHTPTDRPMVTLPTSLPAPVRVPLEYAIHRWTNDTLDRWLTYLLMWAHSSEYGHAVPIRVAARLAAVLSGRPWIRVFHTSGQTSGLRDPFQLLPEGGIDTALWDAILDPSESTYIP